ncbi:MAG: succinate dehydrogenase assembly factor 2 [Rickettsiales bacterium]|jgi:antitoxin CptB|nr:succinate dehydrogenase assembly factor 2 [Rickettsiales bacterium]
MNSAIDENLIKKIIYRSNHRGCKETDILVGKYTISKIHNFSLEQINLYEIFLDEDDLDIYNWLTGKFQVPDEYALLIEDILTFTQAGYDN